MVLALIVGEIENSLMLARFRGNQGPGWELVFELGLGIPACKRVPRGQHPPDIKNCYEGEKRGKKKNSSRQTKYVSASDHKLPFPVPARRCPRYISETFIPVYPPHGDGIDTKIGERESEVPLRGGGFLPDRPFQIPRNRSILLIHLLIYNLYIQHDTVSMNFFPFSYYIDQKYTVKKKINRVTWRRISMILSKNFERNSFQLLKSVIVGDKFRGKVGFRGCARRDTGHG